MAGPPRKPAELARKQGNPGKRKLPELATVISLQQVDDAPLHLNENSKALWQDIKSRATWVAQTDEPALLLVCEKFDRRAKLIAQLESSDVVLYTDKGYAYANPLVGMISTIENEIFKILGSLGLTPSDRTKLGVAEVKRASALDELIARRSQK
jgi:P27 family predicted phage terminase small subunit